MSEYIYSSTPEKSISNGIASCVAEAAKLIGASLIIVFTTTGSTALKISK